ncbi:GH16864 [Drosophila grimshawi]|uniref:GH16864 n=1 Tax=Drosophila grimshawi TaxID=7222 RepID=B4IXA2_DROGR|nr:GH16864 [Drosophila grimshawi]
MTSDLEYILTNCEHSPRLLMSHQLQLPQLSFSSLDHRWSKSLKDIYLVHSTFGIKFLHKIPEQAHLCTISGGTDLHVAVEKAAIQEKLKNAMTNDIELTTNNWRIGLLLAQA